MAKATIISLEGNNVKVQFPSKRVLRAKVSKKLLKKLVINETFDLFSNKDSKGVIWLNELKSASAIADWDF